MTELWDVYDEEARRTGRTMKRGEPVQGDYMLCVHIYLYTSDGKFLMQKRALNKESHPGEWDVTGGAVLSGEESLEGAMRETQEEVGISLNPEDMYLAGRIKKKKSFVDIYFAKKDFDICCCTLQKEEVSEAKFVSLEEMLYIEKNLRKRDSEYMSILYEATSDLDIE